MHSKMTSRERIKAAISSEHVDKLPIFDFLWQHVPAIWKTQGLGDTQPKDYFAWDIDVIFIDTSPRMEIQILEEDGNYITYRDHYGYTIKKLADKSGTLDFLDYPAKTYEQWHELRNRLILDQEDSARIDTESYFAHFNPYPSWDEAMKKCKSVYDTDRYVLCSGYGPWEAAWRLRGLEQLLMDSALDKELLQDISGRHIDLIIATLAKAIDMGIKFDGFWIVDDLGSNHGLLISPESWRELFRPDYMRLGEFLYHNNLDFWIHSCGRVTDLLDDWIDCGIQVLQPLQVSAGMNVFELKKRYCKNLAYMGNLAVQEMAGPVEKLDAKLKQLSKLAATRSGYILSSDHSVSSEITFDRYRYIAETAQKNFDEYQ